MRLLKKAMKQRRGSVDNVAETLMATLAAGGESQESVARAMVKVAHAHIRKGTKTPSKQRQPSGVVGPVGKRLLPCFDRVMVALRYQAYLSK